MKKATLISLLLVFSLTVNGQRRFDYYDFGAFLGTMNYSGDVATGVISGYLSEVYKKLGKYKQALEMHELYMETKDSIAKMDAEEQLYKFEIDKKYELEKQADSIKHADEIILHQAEAKTQKQRSNGLVLITIIILVSLALVFTQLKKVKKGKLLVEERNLVIEEKQKEITDSINYAKRLQDGILVPFHWN